MFTHTWPALIAPLERLWLYPSTYSWLNLLFPRCLRVPVRSTAVLGLRCEPFKLMTANNGGDSTRSWAQINPAVQTRSSARKSRSLGSEVTPTEPSLPSQPSRNQRRSWETTSSHSALWHALDYFNHLRVANYHACWFMTSDECINHIQDVCAFINAFAAPFNLTAIKSA